MTFRLVRSGSSILFEGLLDADALRVLRDQLGSASRVLLRAGTEVELESLEALQALGVELVAEPPFLARWLHEHPTP